MSEEGVIRSLKELGLTEYEAKAYTALTKIKSGLASDVHIISGIPRSAVYGALNKLIEKGIVEIQHGKPMKYRVVSPKIALERLKNDFKTKSERVLEHLEQIYKTDEVEPKEEAVWSVKGIKNVIGRAVEMIENSQEEITLIAAYPFFVDVASAYPIFKNIRPILLEKVKKGVKIRIVASNEGEIKRISKDIPQADIRIRNTHDESIGMKGGLLLVDGREILIVVFGDQSFNGLKDMTAIWSSGEGIVSIFKYFAEMEWNISTPIK